MLRIHFEGMIETIGKERMFCESGVHIYEEP